MPRKKAWSSSCSPSPRPSSAKAASPACAPSASISAWPTPRAARRRSPSRRADFASRRIWPSRRWASIPRICPSAFAAPDLAVTRWGTVKIDHATSMTSLPGVFAGRRHRARRVARRLGDPRRARRRRAHPCLSHAAKPRPSASQRSSDHEPRISQPPIAAMPRISPRRGLYDPREEHDACGVGLVAALDGKPRRDVVEAAIDALKSVWHRGAVDADGKTGDGAGIHVQIPQDFFQRRMSERGGSTSCGPASIARRHDLPAAHRPRRPGALPRIVVEREILRFGYYHLWLAPGAGERRRASARRPTPRGPRSSRS